MRQGRTTGRVEDRAGTETPRATAGYADHDVPLRSYAGAVAMFPLALGVALAVAERRGPRLPDRIGLQDTLLAGVATHKLSRLIARGKVTSAVRAPFTRRQDTAGRGEVEEAPRGTGHRRVLGELLVCPYCLSQWIAGAMTIGLVTAPRPTRIVMAIFTASAASDFLQTAYRAADGHG